MCIALIHAYNFAVSILFATLALCLSVSAFATNSKVPIDYNLFLSSDQTELYGFIANRSGDNRRIVLPQNAESKHIANVDTRKISKSLITDCRPLSRWQTRRIVLEPNDCRSFVLPLKPDVDRWGTRTADPRRQRWQLPNTDWLIWSKSDVSVHLHLPKSYKVSAPWPINQSPASASMLVHESPLNARGLLIFGDFISVRTEMAGMTLDIAYLANEKDYDKIYFWLKQNINQMINTVPTPPTPSLQVIVSPSNTGRFGEPVPFGRVLRAGNQAIQFFVNTHQSYDAFIGDWTAAHEFSHLMLPYLGNEGRWISEGFAGYYGYVLMAHMGQYSEQHAWQKLLKGFRQAKSEWPAVTPNESYGKGMGRYRMMIYWSGAVLALIADTEIRQESKGKQSLNTVLADFARCCMPSARTWSNTELFAKLDQFTPSPIFIPLYRQYADSKGLPNVEPVLEQLGVDHHNLKRVKLIDAPLSNIRSQIMSEPKIHTSH